MAKKNYLVSLILLMLGSVFDLPLYAAGPAIPEPAIPDDVPVRGQVAHDIPGWLRRRAQIRSASDLIHESFNGDEIWHLCEQARQELERNPHEASPRDLELLICHIAQKSRRAGLRPVVHDVLSNTSPFFQSWREAMLSACQTDYTADITDLRIFPRYLSNIFWALAQCAPETDLVDPVLYRALRNKVVEKIGRHWWSEGIFNMLWSLQKIGEPEYGALERVVPLVQVLRSSVIGTERISALETIESFGTGVLSSTFRGRFLDTTQDIPLGALCAEFLCREEPARTIGANRFRYADRSLTGSVSDIIQEQRQQYPEFPPPDQETKAVFLDIVRHAQGTAHPLGTLSMEEAETLTQM